MKFRDEMKVAFGHCAPVEHIEAFAEKLEHEIVGYIDWRLAELKGAAPGKKAAAKADAVSADAADAPAEAN